MDMKIDSVNKCGRHFVLHV